MHCQSLAAPELARAQSLEVDDADTPGEALGDIFHQLEALASGQDPPSVALPVQIYPDLDLLEQFGNILNFVEHNRTVELIQKEAR